MASCASCPIKLVGFCDHQYLWKESIIDILGLLHVNSHHVKVPSHDDLASETTIFGWVWSDVLLTKSNCRILWLSTCLEGINWYLKFFVWRQSQEKVASKHLVFGVSRCTSSTIGFQDSLIISLSGGKRLLPLTNDCHFIFIFVFITLYL